MTALGRRKPTGHRARNGGGRVPVSVRTHTASRDRLDELAAAHGCDRSDLIRRYCAEGVARDIENGRAPRSN